MKMTTEFTNLGCEFCLVSRPSNNNSHLTAFFREQSGQAGTRRINQETVKI